MIREYIVDSDGVIDMPERVAVFRHQVKNEIIELRIEFYSGADGQRRQYTTRTVVKRVTSAPAKLEALNSAERRRLDRLRALPGSQS